ncbi:helix-turn-helix domain-containing protein [Clostridium sp.]|uniref:winged helix-turn-helix domain-containing protein n=1 Tax=Clostridium sp. TaxID=1506 RepID=UPI001A37A111|nr:helix-turn-helix domain-containing protein [Clostridium sp.]MBK5235970.1 winged helix-turn-helix domain-containing protein [Clostridium sp.]
MEDIKCISWSEDDLMMDGFTLCKNIKWLNEELYQHIWESIDVNGNNTVTVHIKALREKIKDNIKDSTFTQTVWGTGYKFIRERHMKLKKWLSLSHLIIMLAPIITAAILFKVIVDYNKNNDLRDYLLIMSKFKVYEDKIQSPEIYNTKVLGVAYL